MRPSLSFIELIICIPGLFMSTLNLVFETAWYQNVSNVIWNFPHWNLPRVGRSSNISDPSISWDLILLNGQKYLRYQVLPGRWCFWDITEENLHLGTIYNMTMGHELYNDLENKDRNISNQDRHINLIGYLLGSYLIFVIFLHRQNFWIIKFTPKNANFSR